MLGLSEEAANFVQTPPTIITRAKPPSGGANSFVTLATLQGVTNATTADLIFPAPGASEIV